MQDDILALEPKDRLKVLLDIAKYIIPSLKSTELKKEYDFKTVRVDLSKLTSQQLEALIKIHENNDF